MLVARIPDARMVITDLLLFFVFVFSLIQFNFLSILIGGRVALSFHCDFLPIPVFLNINR